MNQLAIDFSAKPRCVVPDEHTDLGKLLRAFQRGERHTMKTGLLDLGISALTQRANDLRRAGWPIQREWLTTPKGARVRVYFMEAH